METIMTFPCTTSINCDSILSFCVGDNKYIRLNNEYTYSVTHNKFINAPDFIPGQCIRGINNKIPTHTCIVGNKFLTPNLNVYNDDLSLYTTLDGSMLRMKTDDYILSYDNNTKKTHIYSVDFEYITTLDGQLECIEQHNIIYKNERNQFLYNIKTEATMLLEHQTILIDDLVITHGPKTALTINKLKKNNNECSICMVILTEKHALVPCGHTNICSECYANLDDHRCPICRTNIANRIKLYL